MRILESSFVSSASTANNGKSSHNSSVGGFSIDLSVAPRYEAKAPMSILTGVEAFIAIQSEDASKDKRRRGARRGQAILEVLDELKIALLSGALPASFEKKLGNLLQENMPNMDPQLDEIIQAIELRAAVELAKLRQRQVR